MLELVVKAKEFYERLERFNPVVFFFGGFTWDSLTLKRIDRLLDNMVLLTYLILLGALIIIINLIEVGKLRKNWILKHQKWYPLGLQFFLGGLLSAYVIFYFQSASFGRSYIFLSLLVVLLLANEVLEKRLRNLYLILSLYFIAAFSFFIFFIPVLFKVQNVLTFLLGGLVSAGLVYGIVHLLFRLGIFANRMKFYKAAGLVAGLYLMINVFYLFNWIPPVPLSFKSGGIYHHASRDNASGTFTLQFEKPKWHQIFKSSDDTFHYSTGDTVSCFTAVFAPTELREKIFHRWQKYSEDNGEWVTTDRLGFTITGYRDGGYRGITRKRNVSEGRWRVKVETDEESVLSRINFDVVPSVQSPVLETIYR